MQMIDRPWKETILNFKYFGIQRWRYESKRCRYEAMNSAYLQVFIIFNQISIFSLFMLSLWKWMVVKTIKYFIIFITEQEIPQLLRLVFLAGKTLKSRSTYINNVRSLYCYTNTSNAQILSIHKRVRKLLIARIHEYYDTIFETVSYCNLHFGCYQDRGDTN